MEMAERKLKIIELIIKTQDEKLLQKLLAQLEDPKSPEHKPWMKFAGILNDEEAEKIKKDMEEGCGKY